MSLEEWAPVPRHPEYAVSNEGHVFRLETFKMRRCRSRSGREFDNPVRTKARYVAGYRSTAGYQQVGLGKHDHAYVQRLVMRAFVGQCPEDYVVEHINQNKLDNRLENLRYVPNNDRIFYFGEDSPQCRHGKATIARLRRAHAKGGTTHAGLAADFGVSKTHARRVVRWESRIRG